MSLDHGVLSIPNRTSSINRKLDAYKREQEKARRAEANERQKVRLEARALLSKFEGQLLAAYSEKFGKAKLRKALRSMARYESTKFIRLVEKFKSEMAQALRTGAGDNHE